LVDGLDHVRGRLEVEVERVADVEGENFVSLACDFVGDAGEIADGVADVFQTGSGGDFAQLSYGHTEILTAEGAAGAGKIQIGLLERVGISERNRRSAGMKSSLTISLVVFAAGAYFQDITALTALSARIGLPPKMSALRTVPLGSTATLRRTTPPILRS